MNILYHSVHAVLEDDEVRLFKSLGHNVCCLGVNGPNGASQPYRPSIEWNDEELRLYKILADLGGSSYIENMNIPHGFIDNFDVCVAMHDTNFFGRYWGLICGKPVIWRAIGQAIENLDQVLKVYRPQGLYIARYAASEGYITHGVGQDALIRFSKRKEQYCDWNGRNGKVLTFVANYRQRYPQEADDYMAIMEGLPALLGGSGNADIAVDSNLGLVTQAEQIRQLRDCRVYFYGSGLSIPYTLNFIEAWMTGIPLVLYAPLDRIGRYFEIDRLITDQVDGFVCRDIVTARRRITDLLNDDDLAAAIGAAGRAAAIHYFDAAHIGPEWTKLFRMVTAAEPG